MRFRPFHFLVILIAFVLIKNRFVFAGRKYFLKKLLKGAVLASLIRPNYVPIPVPIPMSNHHGPHIGHLNTPALPLPIPNLMHHHQSWPASRHLVHHLPELPLNHLSWSTAWPTASELQASMRSPIIAQPPSTNHYLTNHFTNQLSSNLAAMPFGMPLSQDTNALSNDYQTSALSNLQTLDLFKSSPSSTNDPLDPLSARASNQVSNYSFRKWFGKKNLKKDTLIY